VKTVGAYEAKTHLSQLLDEVAAGHTVAITRHGVEVARLVPAMDSRRMKPSEAVAALRAARRGVRLQGITVRSLIDEGRRS